MSDLIRREDVDKAIQGICDLCGEDKKNNGVMCGACNLDSFIRDFENIPSAEPERKKGEWIKEKENVVLCYCSECGYKVASALSNLFYNYCPNCGADMRGDDEIQP